MRRSAGFSHSTINCARGLTSPTPASARIRRRRCLSDGWRRRSAVSIRRFPTTTTEQVVRTLSHPQGSTLIENNRWFHDLLTNGVPVESPEATNIVRNARRAGAADRL